MRRRLLLSLGATSLALASFVSAASNPVAGDELLPGIDVDSTRYREAVAAVSSAEARLVETEATILRSDRFLEELRLAERQLSETIPGIEQRREIAAKAHEIVSAEIGVLAQEFYVLGDTSAVAVMAKLLNTEKSLEIAKRIELFEALQLGRIAQAKTLRNTLVDADFAISTAQDGLVQLRLRIESNEVARTNAIDLRERLVVEIPVLLDERALSRRIANVRGADFQLVTLDAYRRAASNAPAGCNINWTLLAGIGRVESRHGRYGGREVLPFGHVSEDIIGIPLNGENSTLEILDTDGGDLDGDLVYDRAVGPMQFIPTTWAAFSADGNGDGVIDPQNIYDSAAAAANYLCRSGDLSDTETRRQAIRRYNNSEAYVTAVLGHQNSYLALGIN